MWSMIPIILAISICYFMIKHSKETFQEGNKLGGTAIAALIPIVIFFSIYFLLYK
ncbi:hypothetical protein ACTNEO_19685 [Gracilibacillus sp. HCP3S3_G5_1]|uniref:hypothetical protein n=1 Tax=unclassified Gracilibacillus TaxID=2625209 RepID=UPI003F8B29F4